MEVMLSQYQAVVLNRAIQIFGTRKIGRNTLVDDAYVLQKRLAVWISENTPKTGNSSSASVVAVSARLAFNTVINDNRVTKPPTYSSTYSVVGNSSAVGVSNIRTTSGMTSTSNQTSTSNNDSTSNNNVSFLAG
tara:strand:+ start:4051 stop:4452 length:402 start_codon:yes stop_codon:yes gene_type:complete